jgi:8-hydroxy-5-deazaflavin:NADPH oxidoreductase
MKIGFIGAGNVAQVYARHFVRHGHEVVLSNRRGPETLAGLVNRLGPKARAGTVQEAANQDFTILAVRWDQAAQALAGVPDWKGRILVDATNRSSDDETRNRLASEVIAGYAPGARLVKGLNTLVVDWIEDAPDNKTKLVLFLSGDDADAKQKVARALDASGFVPVDLGGLAGGGRLHEFGAPLSGLHLNLIRRLEF